MARELSAGKKRNNTEGKMSIAKGLRRVGIALALLLCLQPAMARELVLSAPPRESKAEGQALYGPLAAHLSKLLGVKVTYQHPGNWLIYQRDMRADKYDFVFDGPHFVSWRIANLDHEVVARLSGDLEFYLYKLEGDGSINKLSDLIEKKFCGIAPPNLATLSILAEFKNPVRQPLFRAVRGGMGKAYKALKEGKCQAAVARTSFYMKKLPANELEIIFKSPPRPNQALTVSSRLSPEQRARIKESLTVGAGVESTRGILKRFGDKGSKTFLPAHNEQYKGYDKLLKLIFGW
jgi:ABC-type phosphate/phosphonate transport system substrate-binding protein